jgi:TonB-dependent SusC/RagA subfamily outer membrane receptor
MNHFVKSLFSIVVSILITSNIVAQDRAIHGIITTFDSIPLIGASVKMQSSKQTVLTDTLGRFSMVCLYEDKFVVSAKGFYNQKVKLSKNIKIIAVNLKLKPGEKNREYAIGYGHISEKDRTTAITLLKKEDTDFTRYANMYELIRTMGVEVINGEVIIRGSKSFQLSGAALIVVDNAIVESSYLRVLSPRDVKNINIIKDGSSAVYGSQGANGVVLIETKKGGDN